MKYHFSGKFSIVASNLNYVKGNYLVSSSLEYVFNNNKEQNTCSAIQKNIAVLFKITFALKIFFSKSDCFFQAMILLILWVYLCIILLMTWTWQTLYIKWCMLYGMVYFIEIRE